MWLWSSPAFCFAIIIFNVTPGPPISALPLYCTAYLEIKKSGNASFGFIILRDHQIHTFQSNLGWKVLEINQVICSFFLPCLFALRWAHPHPKFGILPVQMLGYWGCWPPFPFLSSDGDRGSECLAIPTSPQQNSSSVPSGNTGQNKHNPKTLHFKASCSTGFCGSHMGGPSPHSTWRPDRNYFHSQGIFEEIRNV